MRWLDDVSTDLRKMGIKRMERQSKGSRDLEPYCKGGQGPPRAVAPSKKNNYLHSNIIQTTVKSVTQNPKTFYKLYQLKSH